MKPVSLFSSLDVTTRFQRQIQMEFGLFRSGKCESRSIFLSMYHDFNYHHMCGKRVLNINSASMTYSYQDLNWTSHLRLLNHNFGV